ncbi:C6 finger domain protein, putative [Talaromyces stipitatus ATCC 10500]|uniref:C6 finger domain protein, putative n=1 Tax=Talaromyces stipitatus (strain ATCC 10500 / CBS 375.48 / QM 6759 / NRRL 1006) TaxID=441959 RepID=B8LY67_TALSN|nr:C6 finger domain protein, putative [Talaromyces stipitatus ATCC 10500]EED23312.1 C6 finger domain protein, putative [Talaromyces stipitatus ATCC 10500]
MNSREPSDLPPTPSYPANSAQVNQNAIYYAGRQLTADEILTAELSRDAAGNNLGDGSSNDQQHNNAFVFPPNQQAGVDPNHDLSYGDQSARRKRSKVSRACDECRRKKVRCDATSESGVETCSNCRRLGVACQFSRVPMKRGPSKGYIKELAERLNTLESQIQPPMAQQDIQYQGMSEISPPRGYHDFSPPIDGNLLGRKRTFSISEGIHGLPLTQPTFAPRSQATVGETSVNLPESYPLFGMHQPQPKVSAPYWSDGLDRDLALPVESVVGVLSQPANDETKPYTVDEGALKTYYEKIHPILPILPSSKERLHAILHKCGRMLQEVFSHAFYAVTHTNIERVRGTFTDVDSLETALGLISTCLRDPYNLRILPVNIAWIQTLAFLVIDCDKRGPDNLHGRDGCPKQTLVDHLMSLAYRVAKPFDQNRDLFQDFQDVDSDANIARRGWFSASILCRWHLVGMGERDFVDDDIQDINLPTDYSFMGPATVQLASYSSELSSALRIIEIDHDSLSLNSRFKRASRSLLFHMLKAVLGHEQRLANTDATILPVGYLEALGPQVYWTVNLYITRFLYIFAPYEVIHSAEALVKEMHKDTLTTRIPSPIDIYSLSLAVITLLEASKLPLCAEFCWKILEDIEQILDRRAQVTATAGEFEDLFSTPKWDQQLRAWIAAEKPAQQQQNNNSNNVNTEELQPADTTDQQQNQSSMNNITSNTNTNNNADNKNNNASSSQPPLVGPNEQRSLQHLADLAVGAEGSGAGANDDGNAAPATTTSTAPGATATVPANDVMDVSNEGEGGAGAGNNTTQQQPHHHQQQQQQQQGSAAGIGVVSGAVIVDFASALRRGFMNILSLLPASRH